MEVCDILGYDINTIMYFTSTNEDGNINWNNIKYKKGDLIIDSPGKIVFLG